MLFMQTLGLDVNRTQTRRYVSILVIPGLDSVSPLTQRRRKKQNDRLNCDPDHGSIEFEGVNLAKLNIHRWYSDQIGIVSQEPSLFFGTIGKNIAYSYPGATQKEIEAATIVTNTNSFIRTFPKGYKTEFEKVAHNFQDVTHLLSVYAKRM